MIDPTTGELIDPTAGDSGSNSTTDPIITDPIIVNPIFGNGSGGIEPIYVLAHQPENITKDPVITDPIIANPIFDNSDSGIVPLNVLANQQEGNNYKSSISNQSVDGSGTTDAFATTILDGSAAAVTDKILLDTSNSASVQDAVSNNETTNNTQNNTNATNSTVPMKNTGVPLVPFALSALMIVSGALVAKSKKLE